MHGDLKFRVTGSSEIVRPRARREVQKRSKTRYWCNPIYPGFGAFVWIRIQIDTHTHQGVSFAPEAMKRQRQSCSRRDLSKFHSVVFGEGCMSWFRTSISHNGLCWKTVFGSMLYFLQQYLSSYRDGIHELIERRLHGGINVGSIHVNGRKFLPAAFHDFSEHDSLRVWLLLP